MAMANPFGSTYVHLALAQALNNSVPVQVALGVSSSIWPA